MIRHRALQSLHEEYLEITLTVPLRLIYDVIRDVADYNS